MNKVFVVDKKLSLEIVKNIKDNLLISNYYGKLQEREKRVYIDMIRSYSTSYLESEANDIIDSLYYKLLDRKIKKQCEIYRDNIKVKKFICKFIKKGISFDIIMCLKNEPLKLGGGSYFECPPSLLCQLCEKASKNKKIKRPEISLEIATQMLRSVDFREIYKYSNEEFASTIKDYLIKNKHEVNVGFNHEEKQLGLNVLLIDEPMKVHQITGKPISEASLSVNGKPVFWFLCYDKFLCEYDAFEINEIINIMLDKRGYGAVVSRYGVSSYYETFKNVSFCTFDEKLSSEITINIDDLDPVIDSHQSLIVNTEQMGAIKELNKMNRTYREIGINDEKSHIDGELNEVHSDKNHTDIDTGIDSHQSRRSVYQQRTELDSQRSRNTIYDSERTSKKSSKPEDFFSSQKDTYRERGGKTNVNNEFSREKQSEINSQTKIEKDKVLPLGSKNTDELSAEFSEIKDIKTIIT